MNRLESRIAKLENHAGGREFTLVWGDPTDRQLREAEPKNREILSITWAGDRGITEIPAQQQANRSLDA